MPAKPDDSWRQYFNQLSRTLKNFELRIENIEKQVSVLSKKYPKIPAESSTEVIYESPPKRRLGWGLVWLFFILYFGRWFVPFVRYLPFPEILAFASLIA